MKKKYGIVLEGGGFRGIFTAGVLDAFMEKNIKFPYVCGVSMGACNAMGLISGQIGRTKRSILHEGSDPYYGPEIFLKTGRFLDIDITFDEYPFKQYPFDFDSYFSSDVEADYALTNMETGGVEFKDERADTKRLLNIVKASSSLPMISKPVEVDGARYLDGGIADPLPVKQPFLRGCKKAIIVMTKPKGYMPPVDMQMTAAAGVVFRKYPKFLETYRTRNITYIKRLRLISLLEDAGMAYVIRPEIPEIERFETDRNRLVEYYMNGCEVAENRFEEMIRFLGEENIIYND